VAGEVLPRRARGLLSTRSAGYPRRVPTHRGSVGWPELQGKQPVDSGWWQVPVSFSRLPASGRHLAAGEKKHCRPSCPSLLNRLEATALGRLATRGWTLLARLQGQALGAAPSELHSETQQNIVAPGQLRAPTAAGAIAEQDAGAAVIQSIQRLSGQRLDPPDARIVPAAQVMAPAVIRANRKPLHGRRQTKPPPGLPKGA